MIKTNQRYIPKDYVEYKPEIGDYPKDLFAVYVNMEKLSAIFYSKKQSTHTFFNRFSSVEAMKEKINRTIGNLMSWEDTKAERKEARKAAHSLKVGDILYSSWGYEQTNINFYQVTKVISNRTVEIREIHSKIVDSSGSSNFVVAVKDSFLTPRGEYDKRGLPMVKRASEKNTIKLSSYEYADLWDGKEKDETASGWGH